MQCGGNDAEIVKQYNQLIDKIKTVCPDSIVTINHTHSSADTSLYAGANIYMELNLIREYAREA